MNTENKTKAIDVFVYLGIGISLIVTITNVLQVVFAAIERKFPDVLTSQVFDVYSSDVRMAIATLIVVYPLYVGLSWYSAKNIATFLYKRDLLVRKMMIYSTLFVAICSLIGTLVSLIYTYLGGELSVRFELKALAVFIVSLSVFGYYFYSLRRDYSKATRVPVIVSLIASVVVVSSLVLSISVIGTPEEMRLKRIDAQRLSDLSRLQQEVFNMFQSTDKLPKSLSELENAFQGYSIPVDPITRTAYRYTVIQQPVLRMNYTTDKKEVVTPAVFELCATFGVERDYDPRANSAEVSPSLDTSAGTDEFYSASNYYYDQSPFWNHGVGEACFKRVISANMYYGK